MIKSFMEKLSSHTKVTYEVYVCDCSFHIHFLVPLFHSVQQTVQGGTEGAAIRNFVEKITYLIVARKEHLTKELEQCQSVLTFLNDVEK